MIEGGGEIEDGEIDPDPDEEIGDGEIGNGDTEAGEIEASLYFLGIFLFIVGSYLLARSNLLYPLMPNKMIGSRQIAVRKKERVDREKGGEKEVQREEEAVCMRGEVELH
jgi:hypothetical protein